MQVGACISELKLLACLHACTHPPRDPLSQLIMILHHSSLCAFPQDPLSQLFVCLSTPCTQSFITAHCVPFHTLHTILYHSLCAFPHDPLSQLIVCLSTRSFYYRSFYYSSSCAFPHPPCFPRLFQAMSMHQSFSSYPHKVIRLPSAAVGPFTPICACTVVFCLLGRFWPNLRISVPWSSHPLALCCPTLVILVMGPILFAGLTPDIRSLKVHLYLNEMHSITFQYKCTCGDWLSDLWGVHPQTVCVVFIHDGLMASPHSLWCSLVLAKIIL